MPITTIQPGSTTQRPATAIAPRQNQDHRFAALLDSRGIPVSDPPSTTPDAAPAEDAASALPATASPPNSLIPLGEINAATPSVSHLLINHPELRHDCWDIIFAKINQGKEFTAMRPGMIVSLNPTSKELVWTEAASSPRSIAPADRLHSAEIATDGQIVLGTIKPDTPTISHLLKSDPRFTGNVWDIIFSDANRGKPYATLKPGSAVTINPQTLELSFRNSDAQTGQPAIAAGGSPVEQVNPAEIPIDHKNFAERLAESVKSYLGQPYHKIDCYELVVRGLKDQGVRYGGANGLRQHLESLAKKQGLPKNAYQNGEGLIEVAGNKLYDGSFARVSNADRQAAEVLAELEPLLHEGMLLSFSTPSRGHTGVIAKRNNQWTYVNSGVIDHQVNGGRVTKRVGEETLAEEIKNWFLLAKKNTTSLKVSAGLFDTQKLKAKANMVANSGADGQDLI